MMDSSTASSVEAGQVAVVPSDLADLEELDDFDVARDEPDPRGYTLVGTGGEEIGRIQSLLVSPAVGRAYFAVVEAGSWFADNRFLVPMELIKLDPDNERAFVPCTRDQCQLAPLYVVGEQEYERHGRYWRGLGTGAPA